MKKHIALEDAIREIKRFEGYLDEDMITRIGIALSRLPAADEAPVRHGTWLPIVEANEDGSTYQAGVCCSECGHPECVETNYCCYCGAVMDGGTQG